MIWRRRTPLLLALVFCLTAPGPALANGPDAAQLTVALYPWVPRLEQFRTALEAEWKKVQPTVPLQFVNSTDWDGGYSNDPLPTFDVFVFDAMFFDYFRSRNWLEPLRPGEVSAASDFVPYAVEGVKVADTFYAIPQLGCANILFYQADDQALAGATTLSGVQRALSQCTYTSEIPPDRRGLMVDMSGGTTNAALYLDAAHSLTGQYPFPLPWDSSQLNQTAIGNMRQLLAMASYENGTAEPSSPYQRATWFSSGWGRAVVGYTEALSAMSEETRQRIGFKVMPLSDTSVRPVFYADVIAVNPATNERGTRSLAVQLANVMAASATMTASIGPGGGSPYPQYLMPTRPTVFQTLGTSFPLYGQMYSLVTGSNPIMFKVSDQSRSWLTAMKNTVRTQARSSYPCGCDYPATQFISDNSAAPPICQATCAGHGTWSGRWTNDYPAAQGQSVCGCTACPTP